MPFNAKTGTVMEDNEEGCYAEKGRTKEGRPEEVICLSQRKAGRSSSPCRKSTGRSKERASSMPQKIRVPSKALLRNVNNNMTKQLQSTLFHAIELVVVLAVVYAASTVLNLGIVSQNQDVFVVVLAALVKFIRASENIKDYVNK